MSNNTKPLASEDPSFPPIAVRYRVLHETPLAGLIEWAKTLDSKVDSLWAAIETILRHEYGEEVSKEFLDKCVVAEKERLSLKTAYRQSLTVEQRKVFDGIMGTDPLK